MHTHNSHLHVYDVQTVETYRNELYTALRLAQYGLLGVRLTVGKVPPFSQGCPPFFESLRHMPPFFSSPRINTVGNPK